MAPLRVVSLVGSSTEMVCALGCGDWLVACPNESDGIDAGALVELRPDVVIMPGGREACGPTTGEIERALATVAGARPRLVAIEPGSLADVWRDFRKVADALGVPERGVQQVTRLQARMRSVAGRAADLRPKPRVACLARIDPLMAAGGWTPELIEMAGAVDLFGTAGGRAARLGWNRLRAADPDAIWIAPRGFDLARTRREMAVLASRPGWARLNAVRSGGVFLGDGRTYFGRPGPRVADALECLAEALHPEAFRFGRRGTGWERWA